MKLNIQPGDLEPGEVPIILQEWQWEHVVDGLRMLELSLCHHKVDGAKLGRSTLRQTCQHPLCPSTVFNQQLVAIKGAIAEWHQKNGT